VNEVVKLDQISYQLYIAWSVGTKENVEIQKKK